MYMCMDIKISPSITKLIVIKTFSKILISFSIILNLSIGRVRVSHDALFLL